MNKTYNRVARYVQLNGDLTRRKMPLFSHLTHALDKFIRPFHGVRPDRPAAVS
jgi:hypothetical protein